MTAPARRSSSMRFRFDGSIAGIGTTSGIRLIVGNWSQSPFGSIVDVMIETAEGHRVLLAPTAAVGEFISAAYTFDEVRIEPTVVRRTTRGWELTSNSLTLSAELGPRTAIGRLLRIVPAPLARNVWWCRAIDPIARVLRPGVRTVGTAGRGRREYYCALDEHALTHIDAVWDGIALGSLEPVEPPVRFGFGSAPRRPTLVRVSTLIDERPR